MYSRILPFFFWRNQLNPFSHPFTSYDFVPDLLHREASEPAPQSSFQIDPIGVFQIARETVCIWYVYIYIYMTYITDWQIVDNIYIYIIIYIHNSWLNIHGSHPCLCHVKFTFDLHCSIYDFTVPIAQERIRSRGAGVADWRPKVTGPEG